MIAWWQQLGGRERFAVTVAAVLVVFSLAYVGVFEPALAENRRLVRQVDAQRQLLTEVKALADEAVTLRRSARPAVELPAGQSLLSVTNASARRSGVQSAIKRIVPESDRRLRLQFDRVGFDRMIGWLTALSTDFGIEVQALSIERLEDAGIVRADLVLEAG